MESQVQYITNKYLQNVRPTGEGNLRATCPFCGSKRAFIVNLDTGLWICFSCSLRGALPQLLYKLGFTRKQVDRLVTKDDLMPKASEFTRRKAELREDWEVLPEYVLSSFDECPIQMLNLGFDMEFLKEQDIGFDKRENRITFPIRDYKGRLVGVSGRAHNGVQYPRYKVYDEVFKDIAPGYVPLTRKHLYGFHEVYAATYFSAPDDLLPIIIVEGYKGCLWLKQMGYTHTVALQGSSLTRDQQRMLERVRGPKYILLDNEPGKSFSDRPGGSAADKIAERLSRTDRAFLCQYPEHMEVGTSPDDLTVEEAESIINNAKTTGHLRAHQRSQYTSWRRK